MTRTQDERKNRDRKGYATLARCAPFYVSNEDGTTQVERVTYSVARSFGVDEYDLHARTVDRIARWVGGLDSARVDDMTQPVVQGLCGADMTHHYCTVDGCDAPTLARYWVAIARKVARQSAPRIASGGGSMPRLTVDEDVDEESRTVQYVNEDGALVLLDEDERTLWAKVERYERAESDVFNPWMDGRGRTVPSVGTPHPFGMEAQDIPERDSATLARASLEQRVQESARWTEDARVALVAVDYTRITTRGNHAVDWATVARLTGDDRHRSTLQRVVRNVMQSAVRSSSVMDRETVVDGTHSAPVERHHCTEDCTHSAPVVAPNRAPVGAYVHPDETNENARIAYARFAPCTHSVHPCGCGARATVAMEAQDARIALRVAVHGVLAS